MIYGKLIYSALKVNWNTDVQEQEWWTLPYWKTDSALVEH